MDFDKIDNIVDKVAESVDDNIESAQERQDTLSSRHAIDMASDNKLSKMIRPISLIWGMSLLTIVLGFALLLAYQEKPGIEWVIGEVILLVAPIISFYFTSKRAERIAEKRAIAAVQIERAKADAEVKIRTKEVKERIRVMKRARKRGELDE